MLKEEKVYFTTSDGLTLCGILSKPQNETDKCIILCHGIAVDKEEDGIFTNLVKELVDTGFNVFRFDFRGHGESEGKSVDMTIMGEVKDLEAAINFLKKKGYTDFSLLGASFAGGAVSIFSGDSQAGKVKALVLWNALSDYSSKIKPVTEWGRKYWGKPAFERVEKFGFTEIGSRKFKIGKGLIDEIKRFKPWSALAKTEIPKLFVHGDRDTYIPVEDSVKYASEINNSSLKIIHGAEHGFHDNPRHAEEANRATIAFFKKYL
jgi:hypothetical protein